VPDESRGAKCGIERTTRAFLLAVEAEAGAPFEELSPAEARAAFAAAQSRAQVALPAADVVETTLDADGRSVRLTVVRPAGSTGVLPVFMFFHGGGWVLGDFATHERLVRDLVVGSGAAAVFVHYDRSPEARYPVAIQQAYAATRWIADHGDELGVDGTRLAVVGNGTGGNMAAVVSRMAKDRGAPNVAFQLLLWPVTNAGFDTASYDAFAEGHFLTREMMRWFWDCYTPDPHERRDAYASPLQASTERLKGVPPALIVTAEMDVLRDEGEAYARRLHHAGVEVTAVRYNGMIHDFALLNPLRPVPGTRSVLLHASQELRKRLGCARATSGISIMTC
jgi:acetyl esterase